eukprot:TRINITY_DN32134_c0_g1_i1.p1 TRINITY_DN32134_c0_g1~~TRINITY_DN32134_c0_g1_i1.p1  ORF type:complete len:464 (-),score=57.41 TRINITY_DN32134_c0_g1_i1:316-1707(-)
MVMPPVLNDAAVVHKLSLAAAAVCDEAASVLESSEAEPCLASQQLLSQETQGFCQELANALGIQAPHQLRWRHGTNSRRRLHRALADNSIHMLEADVCLGALVDTASSGKSSGSRCNEMQMSSGRRNSKRLIMAHYPTTRTSDLSVEEFLYTVMRHNASGVGSPKGVKLDFKQLGCVSSGIAKLVHIHDELSREYEGYRRRPLMPAVFVNGDIVRGPCFAPNLVGRWQEPLPAMDFIQAVTSALAPCQRRQELNAVLSLGWTMGLHIRGGCVLSGKMIDSMLAVLPLVRDSLDSGHLRHITFAVSAACAPASDQALAKVLAAAGAESSLTFFTPTFGRGVTRKEAEALVNYPLCPPYGLFLDTRIRSRGLLQRLRPRAPLLCTASKVSMQKTIFRCTPWSWSRSSTYDKLKHEERLASPSDSCDYESDEDYTDHADYTDVRAFASNKTERERVVARPEFTNAA